MTAPRILIAGIGNIFLGDDGFGVEVVRHMLGRPLPEGVAVVDFGIRGLDLTYALLDGPEVAILVDAAPRGQPPGTLSVVELTMAGASPSPTPEDKPLDMHNLNPVKVLALVRSLGGPPLRLFLVACEPADVSTAEEMAEGLSAPVQAAVASAVAQIDSLISTLLAEPHAAQPS